MIMIQEHVFEMWIRMKNQENERSGFSSPFKIQAFLAAAQVALKCDDQIHSYYFFKEKYVYITSLLLIKEDICNFMFSLNCFDIFDL